MSSPQVPLPPQPPPVPVKKTSPLVWILVGIISFMFLIGAVIAVGGYLFMNKVKQVAGSPAGVVKMMAAMNPDVEVISTDDSNGKITLKDKKSGKVITMNFDDVKNGKITFQEEGKEAVNIQAKGNGDAGSVDISGPDGKMHFGSGSGKVPAWVPAYPGSTPHGTYSASSDKEETGHYSFTTPDAVDKVAQYYQDQLKQAGYSVNSVNAGGTIVTGHTEDNKRTLGITLVSVSGETTASVTYNEKK